MSISEKEVVSLLKSLESFNKLDDITIDLMTEEYDIDCYELCKKNGIVYTVTQQ